MGPIIAIVGAKGVRPNPTNRLYQPVSDDALVSHMYETRRRRK